MNDQKISDQELIRLYQQGNEACLETLIKRHQRNVYTAIYLLVRNRALSEDIFQEAFIKIIHTIRSDKYNEEGKFAPWAARIARNLTIDYIRKMKRDVTITDSEGNDIFNYITIAEESNEDKMIRSQSEHNVRQLVKRLPEEQRQVLIMRQWGNMSFQEIADATGVSINTALGRMRYALNNLRKMMEQQKIRV
ncbi:RNA polymerase subunit sigma-24 [Bacteroidetes bacterium UKL13-3]|jgi:RNA polymerase sigma-70 factor (ECF subfamily)|nr:RNA polymerase subunit sigma-24 [Bacteroidetes bacterium UKL13-3]HCP93872.1 RNA polymerase subunit sigma-24 [Bacteroidota bacterium]